MSGAKRIQATRAMTTPPATAIHDHLVHCIARLSTPAGSKLGTRAASIGVTFGSGKGQRQMWVERDPGVRTVAWDGFVIFPIFPASPKPGDLSTSSAKAMRHPGARNGEQRDTLL